MIRRYNFLSTCQKYSWEAYLIFPYCLSSLHQTHRVLSTPTFPFFSPFTVRQYPEEACPCVLLSRALEDIEAANIAVIFLGIAFIGINADQLPATRSKLFQQGNQVRGSALI